MRQNCKWVLRFKVNVLQFNVWENDTAVLGTVFRKQNLDGFAQLRYDLQVRLVHLFLV